MKNFLYFRQQKIVLSGVRPLVEFYQTYPPDTAELSSEDDTQRLGWISVAFYACVHTLKGEIFMMMMSFTYNISSRAPTDPKAKAK